jgi:hypothetical protein
MTGVDYGCQDVARRYAEGRTLSDHVLARRHQAVCPFGPTRPRTRVLDACPRWRPCDVVALKRSAAVIGDDGRTPPNGSMWWAGVGSGSRSGRRRWTWPGCRRWCTTSADLDACARELRRVVADVGVVLIRACSRTSARPPACGSCRAGSARCPLSRPRRGSRLRWADTASGPSGGSRWKIAVRWRVGSLAITPWRCSRAVVREGHVFLDLSLSASCLLMGRAQGPVLPRLRVGVVSA